jgi:hypothetical protein
VEAKYVCVAQTNLRSSSSRTVRLPSSGLTTNYNTLLWFPVCGNQTRTGALRGTPVGSLFGGILEFDRFCNDTGLGSKDARWLTAFADCWFAFATVFRAVTTTPPNFFNYVEFILSLQSSPNAEI